MPIVELKFNLPEEQAEFNTTMAAGKMHSCLWDMYNYLRADSKYGEGKYKEVYDKFWEILKENNYDLSG